MNLPSVKTIAKALHVDLPQANRIRMALEAARDCLWFNNSIIPAMTTINGQLCGHGVEFIYGRNWRAAALVYVNRGDTYDTTVCYDYTHRRFFIGSWGDWVERNDPHGTKY